MKTNYKNWVPKGMVVGLVVAVVIALALFLVIAVFGFWVRGTVRILLSVLLGLGSLVLIFGAAWGVTAYNAFSFDAPNSLARKVIDGTASYVSVPAGGKGLDVGCGSGALTIACAKRNPAATFLGVDRWGPEYASYSVELCQRNAEAEGVSNASFQKGDAMKLDFPDETFDAVTSNYVYHNIGGVDKQGLLLETLRVLKKGGTFAIHDLMSQTRYGDMQRFASKLREQGYERVELIDTTDGKFMSANRARILLLHGSTLLIGKK